MTDDGTDGSDPADTITERGAESRLKLRVLMVSNRWVIAGAILAGVGAVLIALGAVDPIGLRARMNASDPVETLFQGLLTAIVTGVTLVVSINSLVLSQELGPLGDQRERMSGAMAFREDVEAVLTEPTSPAEPAPFLGALVGGIGERARELRNATAGGPAADPVADYVEEVIQHADAVSDDFDNVEFGTFDLLATALNFNYSWKLYEARRLRAEFDEDLREEAHDALDGLVEALTFYGPAREHFKTLYFQWELVNLSRAMLYTAVPALVMATAAILYLSSPGTVTGTFLGVDALVWAVCLTATASLAPFVVLLSFVLRIATVAKRTLAIGPFVLRSEERSDERDWE